MNKTRIGLLVAAALCALPTGAWAQGKKPPAAGEKPAEAGKEPGKEAAGGEAAAGEAGETPGEEVPGEELPGGEEVPGGEGLGDICKIDPAACPKLDMNKEAAKPLKEQIYAVQQHFVIKARRVEVNPYWSFT